jgi:hypothetical protein
MTNSINRIKQPLTLKWNDLRYENTRLLFSAITPFGAYTIVESNSFTKDHPKLTKISARDFNTERFYISDWHTDEDKIEQEIEHAKRICQEHFIKLLMSCFE